MSIYTSTSQTYAYYCYYKLTTLSLNHDGTRIVLNVGVTVYTESTNIIGAICNKHSSLFESIYIKQMVSNFCASQKYHKVDIFLTFTCNQEDNFWLEYIWNCIDSGIWKNLYLHYFNCTHAFPKKIRNWTKCFIPFLEKLDVNKDNINPLPASK